jgi:hypothetical protein
MVAIPNPPNSPAGYVAEWNGTSWEIVSITQNIIPAMPINIPDGYDAQWNGQEWELIELPPPPPPPTPEQITMGTMNEASSSLGMNSYYSAPGVWDNIIPDSQYALKEWASAVTEILTKAQKVLMDRTGEAYRPKFPPMPTSNPAPKEGVEFTVYFSEPVKK